LPNLPNLREVVLGSLAILVEAASAPRMG